MCGGIFGGLSAFFTWSTGCFVALGLENVYMGICESFSQTHRARFLFCFVLFWVGGEEHGQVNVRTL